MSSSCRCLVTVNVQWLYISGRCIFTDITFSFHYILLVSACCWYIICISSACCLYVICTLSVCHLHVVCMSNAHCLYVECTCVISLLPVTYFKKPCAAICYAVFNMKLAWTCVILFHLLTWFYLKSLISVFAHKHLPMHGWVPHLESTVSSPQWAVVRNITFLCCRSILVLRHIGPKCQCPAPQCSTVFVC